MSFARAVRLARVVLVLAVAGCEIFHAGVEITNAPAPRDCIPGSATRPCN